MREELTARQRRAWTLCAAGVPAAAGCAGIGWQWALLGGAAAGLAFLLCALLHERTGGRSLRSNCLSGFGQTAGRGICATAALWQLLALAALVRAGGYAFPETGDPDGAGLVLLLLAAWAAGKGSRIPARCAGVLLPVLGGIYALLLSCAAGEIRAEWLRPWGTARAALLPCAWLLLPGAVWYLDAPERDGKPGGGAAALLLGPAALALAAAGVMSPRLAAAGAQPFYEMTRGLTLSGAVGRPEPLASAAMLLGYFCAEALLLCSAASALGIEGGRKVWGLAALAALGSRLRLPDARVFWAAGAAIFWALLPIGTQLMVCRKNVGKKVKKELDKTDSV